MQKTKKNETIIEGEPDPKIINQALRSYGNALLGFAYPTDIDKSYFFRGVNITALRDIFLSRLDQTVKHACDIILEINERSSLFTKDEYKELIKKDRSYWNSTNSKEEPVFAVLTCVDKGVPYEALVGIDGIMGRTLAGDIQISYSTTRKKFFPDESAITKRLIHQGRQGTPLFIDTLVVHTSCGRLGQLLTNDGGEQDLPTLGYIFSHVDVLSIEFFNQERIDESLEILRNIWNGYERDRISVKSPDGGLWAGTVAKVAQRQALRALNGPGEIVSPIEIYNKQTGDLLVGIDGIDVLTDEIVQKEGGYTENALEKLISEDKVFSLKTYLEEVGQILSKNGFSEGELSYQDLQENWLETESRLIDVVRVLWESKTDPVVQKMVTRYLDLVTFNIKSHVPEESKELVYNRLTHHLFHCFSYAYILGTFKNGNTPGTHHIENHLAAGDHEIGVKKHIALGQGDLDDPSAYEIFTGYSVLLHSTPGKENMPIPVMIKLDTDRPGTQALSTEETRVAMDDFTEFLKLWPYMLVGELIPYLAVRSKAKGGISRVPSSVVFAFNDIVRLSEKRHPILPLFVPAATSRGEVVLVPAKDVLKTGIKAGGDLKTFRTMMVDVADNFSASAVQSAFVKALQ